MSPQSVPVRETGLDINQPVNQTTQLGSEPAQIGAMGNALRDDINVSSPRTHQQLDELGGRMIDMGTNTSDIEVRPHRDGARVVTSDTNVQAPLPLVDVMIPSGGGDPVPIPQINLSISGYGPDSLRDSQMGTSDMRAQEISILPQVDGQVSVPAGDPARGRVSDNIRFMEQECSQGGTYIQGTSITCRREYPRESNEENNTNRSPYREWRPPERGRYPN